MWEIFKYHKRFILLGWDDQGCEEATTGKIVKNIEECSTFFQKKSTDLNYISLYYRNRKPWLPTCPVRVNVHNDEHYLSYIIYCPLGKL